MEAAKPESLSDLRTVVAFAALHFHNFGDKLPVPTVQVTANSLALRL
jgi:hypothetical protein